jgi:hypothetical protein
VPALGLQNFTPCIHVTTADFDALTAGGKLCNASGCLTMEAFEDIMRDQVCQGPGVFAGCLKAIKNRVKAET